MKKLTALLLATVLCFTLAACGSDPVEDVTLRLWGGEEDQVMLRQMADAFIEANKDKVNLTISLGTESESTAKDTILTDIEAAADVFAFANDQIIELVTAGALQEVSIRADDIKSRNSAGSVEAATVGGKLMAYPMTGDNGYFMYYDASYFTPDDVQTFDRMLEVAAAAGKQITMDMGGAWYSYSFFKGAGLDVSLIEGTQNNFCNWNAAGGTDVVQAMLAIAAHPAFISLGDGEFVTGIENGTIIAGINGPWNAGRAQDAWGANYAAAKLPTFTLAGAQKQMGSFAGFKLVGVNALSANAGWAMELADWITNYENQVKRFNDRQQGPSNTAAAATDAVQADPAQAAFAAQQPFSVPQAIGGNYWSAAGTLFEIIVRGNPDGTDLQTLLDNAVAGITAPVG
ncbi:MAG: extracellular solute-binding protein [Oscillospiraceae bacterium]|nr:extracellular solute-binding protein [Oscillospiraceae bacterium]